VETRNIPIHAQTNLRLQDTFNDRIRNRDSCSATYRWSSHPAAPILRFVRDFLRNKF